MDLREVKRSLALVSLFLVALIALAPELVGAEENRVVSLPKPVAAIHRPKIGLVLKGGGALGLAHVGVLRVLERYRVPVDYLAGTSMGSIVGAAYASGTTVSEMEKILSETDWNALFGEKVKRENVEYRLKSGRNREIFGDTKLSYSDGAFHMPRGVIEGQNIRPLFQRLFGNPPSPMSFDQMPIPFRAVTADIETGAAYVPEKGDLSTVVRASMSIPGAFSPIEMDGRLLVDGGIADNLPVDVARRMGADILIVVDLFSELPKHGDLTSPVSMSMQVVSLLLAQNAALSRKRVQSQDVVIEPDVSGFAVTDFAKSSDLIRIGEEAAEQMKASLVKLSLTQEEYRRYSSNRERTNTEPVKIGFIRIKDATPIAEDKILGKVTLKSGDLFNAEKMEKEIQEVYQTGYFSSVGYALVKEGKDTGVEIEAEPKNYLSQFITLGFAVEDNLEGDDSFRLGAAFRSYDMGTKDAYVEAQTEIGKNPRISLEWYRPIEEGSPYFIAPKFSYGRSNLDLSREGDRIAEYSRTEGSSSINIGRQIDSIGEVSIGYSRGFGKLARQIGDPSFPNSDYNLGDVITTLDLDSLDKPDFPTKGFRVASKFDASVDSLGAPSDFQSLGGALALPISFGRDTILIKNDFAITFGERPTERLYTLGGFTNVSGFLQNALSAADYNSGSVVYFRRFSELENPLFSFDFFAGGSFEMTTLHNPDRRFESYSLINSGSMFVGADTPLLPLYIGFGLADTGDHTFYIAFGRIGQLNR